MHSHTERQRARHSYTKQANTCIHMPKISANAVTQIENRQRQNGKEKCDSISGFFSSLSTNYERRANMKQVTQFTHTLPLIRDINVFRLLSHWHSSADFGFWDFCISLRCSDRRMEFSGYVLACVCVRLFAYAGSQLEHITFQI